MKGNATQAAAMLMISPDALARKVRRGVVPGAKIGRRWVFIEVDLVELIREKARAQASFGRSVASALKNLPHPSPDVRAIYARLDKRIAELQKSNREALSAKARNAQAAKR